MAVSFESYRATIDVINDVVSNKVTVVNFLVVETWIWILTLDLLGLVNHGGLMLELVGNEYIFAQVIR